MLSSLLCILLVTTLVGAANQQNNRATSLSSQYASKENQILDSTIGTRGMKSEVANANDVLIQQEHNLLGVTMSIITRLMEITSLTLSDQSWQILSRMFAAAMSVIFGPNTNIFWPELAHIAVPFLNLLTT